MSSNSDRSNSPPTSDGRPLGQKLATSKPEFKSFTVKTVNAPALVRHRQLKEWVAKIAKLTRIQRDLLAFRYHGKFPLLRSKGKPS